MKIPSLLSVSLPGFLVLVVARPVGAQWHGVDLAEYSPDRYLVVWSYRGPGTDDFALRGAFLDTTGPEPVLNPYFTINDRQEAQEPPGVAYDPATEHFLVVWEDGRRYAVSEVDIRAALLDKNGAVLMNDIEVDLGDRAQHGPAIVRSGSYAVIAYIDERDYDNRAADPVTALMDFNGNVRASYQPVAIRPDDEWWPILSAGESRLLMGWFNGEDNTVTGAILSPTGEVIQHLKLLSGAFPYEYACTWLDCLGRFLVVARSGSGSRAVLVDETGSLSSPVTGLPRIVRESHLLYQETPSGNARVLYCTADGGVAVLDVTWTGIQLRETVAGVFAWTTKGTDGVFIGPNRALFLATTGQGGVPTMVTLNLTPSSIANWLLF